MDPFTPAYNTWGGGYGMGMYGGVGLPQLMMLGATYMFGSGAVSNQYLYETAKWFILGSLVEMARRLWVWVQGKLQLKYSMTATFTSPDPAYEWIMIYLTEENVWESSRHFTVSASSSQRRWGVQNESPSSRSGYRRKRNRFSLPSLSDFRFKKRLSTETAIEDHAEYVPGWGEPHMFRWDGAWIELNAQTGGVGGYVPPPSPGMGGGMNGGWGGGPVGSITLTIFSLDLDVLRSLVAEARQRYLKASAPNITVHIADQHSYSGHPWTSTKSKNHRPLDSLILPPGVVHGLVKDAREFFDSEAWYIKAGIPHHRGYLLHGPPGTGKTSTIYALAGELGLEIYSLSLSAPFVDDSFLQRAASSMPKRSILLMEDIDCAFPSREDLEEADSYMYSTPGKSLYVPGGVHNPKRSNVTLSGLLNVVDGVGSEEGKLFFATTNYVDRLDPALMRPGRIDLKVKYHLASPYQGRALFDRFYPSSIFENCLLEPTTATVDLLEKCINPQMDAVEQDPTSTDVEQMVAEDLSTTAYENLCKHNDPDKVKALRTLTDLSEYFTEGVPAKEFSTAELQGYLLTWKMQPVGAALGVRAWVSAERAEKKRKADQEEERKQKIKEAREKNQQDRDRPVVVNIGGRPYGEAFDQPHPPWGAHLGSPGFPPAPYLGTPPLPDVPAPPSPPELSLSTDEGSKSAYSISNSFKNLRDGVVSICGVV